MHQRQHQCFAITCVLAAVLTLQCSALRGTATTAAHSDNEQAVSPDQRPVESFVSDFTTSTTVPWNTTNPFNSPPVCTWTGVTCDSNLNVVDLNLASMSLNGAPNFTKLPQTLQGIDVSSNSFSKMDLTTLPRSLERFKAAFVFAYGPLDLTQLPPKLKRLNLLENGFSGEVSLDKLPDTLQYLNMRLNTLSGILDVSKLPRSLEVLNLGFNQFNGTLDLTKLPPSMIALDLSFNSMSGPVDLTQLPPSMRYLELRANHLVGPLSTLTKLPSTLQHLSVELNRLSGTVDLTGLPQSLAWLCLDNNQFAGRVDITKLPTNLQHLDLSVNRFTGGLNVSALPQSMGYLNAGRNGFSGSLDFTQLPPTLSTIHLGGNQFTGALDLTQLPPLLAHFNVSANVLQGTVDLTKLPLALGDLDLSDNQLRGPVDLFSLPRNGLALNIDLRGNSAICGNATLPWAPGNTTVFMPKQCKETGSSTPEKMWVCTSCHAATAAASDYKSMFESFKSQHARKYESAAEEGKRFDIFVKNMKKAEKMKKENPFAHFGVNGFADVSATEFKTRHNADKVYAKLAKNASNPAATFTAEQVKAVQKVDWRSKGAVTPVKDQRTCGGCWSFSTIGGIEGQWFLAGHALTSLSEQLLISCDTFDQGCGGGLMDNALDWIVSRNDGLLLTEASYPFVSGGGQVPPCQKQGKTFGAKIIGHQDIAHDEDQMAAFVGTSGPLSIAVVAAYWQSYIGGIMTSCGSPGDQVDHGVLIVGFDKTNKPPYWIVKNSWGPGWGEAGYIRIEYGTNQCLINNYPTTSIVSKGPPTPPAPPSTNNTLIQTRCKDEGCRVCTSELLPIGACIFPQQGPAASFKALTCGAKEVTIAEWTGSLLCDTPKKPNKYPVDECFKVAEHDYRLYTCITK